MSALAERVQRTPAENEAELERIDDRLAGLVDEFESAAEAWYAKKAEREEEHAKAYVGATGNHSERKAAGDQIAAKIGYEEEGTWEGKRHVQKALETRGMVLATLLKAQGRAGG